MIEMLLDFAVGEGVINSNPMVVSEADAALSHLGDLDTHREIVRGRIELLSGDQRREMRGADD
ncbi:hypothetical protein ASD19_06470 [Microbacterium sp. Root53]|uniref:hypothetical protein n=1 Tax=Microbacterium sp. Root53 TaxID=1736553 RepID=UPI0006FF7EA8|nr:hypothetical protein [Microbacterium sp. Root53]KQY98843.1 hypothetical protein ASD19_06470 [Microbacterium sp. Root53]